MKLSKHGRHLADHRSPSMGGRLRNFLRIDRSAPVVWHRDHGHGESSRLVQFLRIARGRTT
jgi:hypothetical protein